MTRIEQIKIPYDTADIDRALEKKIRKLRRLPAGSPLSYTIKRRSLDARKRPDIFYVYTVDVKDDDGDERPLFDGIIPQTVSSAGQARPVICGFGPAGIFAAYILALNGQAPLVIERGEPAEKRAAAVERFWESGVTGLSSNVCFGEGGAGTFSDGKLNTGVKDLSGYGEFVLRTLAEFGAPSEITYDAKPHIGTDRLRMVIPAIRERIVSLGGEVRFGCTLTDIGLQGGKLVSVTVNDSEKIAADTLILAIGHSARDTYGMLNKRRLTMIPKAFAVGFRVEHPQEMIDRAMYGRHHIMPGRPDLPTAPYTLSYTPKDGSGGRGRGVYSFCMCPGGYVVDSSTEDGGICVNGMSYSGRDGRNANSAIVVAVGPDDYMQKGTMKIEEGTIPENEGTIRQVESSFNLLPGDENILAGVEFQRKIEKMAFEAGGGNIPQQLYGDFLKNAASSTFGAFDSCVKGKAAFANLRGILPGEFEKRFIEGMAKFASSIPGFDREDAILSGVEGRTSSPVRIVRNEFLMSDAAEGIYPCGEGAGYAGGITSAAIDGIKVAREVLRRAGQAHAPTSSPESRWQ